jgi:hypothetical protein
LVAARGCTDKLLRYETHLDRQLYRAIDQLELLQRQRRGETVPPPSTSIWKGGDSVFPNKAKKWFVFNDSDTERFCRRNCVLTSTLPRGISRRLSEGNLLLI